MEIVGGEVVPPPPLPPPSLLLAPPPQATNDKRSKQVDTHKYREVAADWRSIKPSVVQTNALQQGRCSLSAPRWLRA